MDAHLLIVPVAALAGPWLLWPLEQVLPFPVVIEEGFKLGLVAWALKHSDRGVGWGYLSLIGLGFGMSETILYLFNALHSGETGAYWLRLVTTVPMHVVTVFVVGWGLKVRLPWLGLVVAVLIHVGFNRLVRGL